MTEHTMAVWLYYDPASGIEYHLTPGIGTKVSMPTSLLTEFSHKKGEFQDVSERLEALLHRATSPVR